MNKGIKNRNIDTVFVLIVFSIFAFSVLMVLMLGAGIYRNINEISRAEQHEHTAFSYVWTKIKNFDDTNAISIGDFDGNPAIFIDETIGGTDYRTAIYIYDGWLLELFSETALEFSPQSGRRIVQTDNMTFNKTDNGLIEVIMGAKRLLVSPRAAG